TPQFAEAQAFWRSERRLRARFGRKVGLREHIPDGEVHWPDTASTAVAWAGECWAIEAELTPKTLAKTVTVMREVLARTGDYGCPAADVAVPGRAPRHARVIYLCSPAALPVVVKAREAVGGLAVRVEIRLLPPEAQWPEKLSRPANRPGPGAPGTSRSPRASLVIRRWLSLLVAQVAFKSLVRIGAALILAAAAVAAAPVCVVAAGGFAAAWYRGWRPRRLMVGAAW